MDQEKIFKLLYEMVENEIIRQEERLLTEVEEEDIGVDYGQGYFISRPLTLEQVISSEIKM